MKTEHLMDCIGQIDDRIIAEADNSTPTSKPAKRPWIKWGAAAAAACLVIAVPLMLNRRQPTDPADFSSLPKLAVNTTCEEHGFGFEGYFAFNVHELYSHNPWSENNDLNTLPVFTNPTQYDDTGKLVKGLSAAEMTAKAQQAASVMGLTIDHIVLHPTEEELTQEAQKTGKQPDPATEYVTADCGSVTITAMPNGHVALAFENGVSLPDGYSFTLEKTTEPQAKEAMQYLLDTYAPLVDMKAPALSLFGDYSVEARRLFDYAAYEKDGDLTDQILGYNFNYIRFTPNDNGELWLIGRSSADYLLSQKIGDYPIITAEKARMLLLDKHYISTVPAELPGEDYIAHVELIYRTGRSDMIFMPYYKFLVEMPTMQKENGLKTFGVFYVPAVKEEFLENMPLWDGGFH